MKRLLIALAVLAALAVGLVALFPARALQADFARQRLWAGASVKSQDVGGERWTYLEAGRGPLIVLVHGYTGSKENWLPVMRRLARGHRVLAVDLPGWGDNVPAPGADYGPLAQAARLDAFLQAQGEPVALLVGHSMGGMIAGLLLSDAHAAPVERVVFMSSAGVRFSENDFARRVAAGDNPFAVYDAAAFLAFLDGYVFADAPYVPLPVARVMVERRAAKRGFERAVFAQMSLGPQAFLLQQRLPRIRQPAGLLWCDRDAIIDVSAAATFAAGLPTSQTRILEGCGHMPMMERPGPVADYLLGRLR